jgi:endonuclease/exonuclease/phosphatase family metal-dependent hydrolase
MRTLFWNLNKKPLTESVGRIARAHGADILVLAESETVVPQELLDSLQRHTGEPFRLATTTGSKVQVCHRHTLTLTSLGGHTHYSLQRVVAPGGASMTLAALHLLSKKYADAALQLQECQLAARDVRDCEAREGHLRTLVIGDFNLNPYDAALWLHAGFSGMMDRASVQQRYRTQQGRPYSNFYNPMWGLFGDRTPGPSGTYFYNAAHGWNVFDQVLLGADLADHLDELSVLTSDGVETLSDSKGKPLKSDHFPVLVNLKL